MSIKCEAKDCTHNDNEGNCYARVVNVRGERAKITNETLCNSFADKRLNSTVEFAEEFNSTRKKATTDSIKCGAQLCRYNKERQCEADTVKVNARTASCETFVI